MHKYAIEIPNTKAATQRLVTIFLLVMNIVVFGYISYAAADNRNTVICMIGAGLNILALTAVFRTKYLRFLEVVRPGIIFIISAVIWAVMGKFLITVLMLFFGLMGIYNSGKLLIVFSAENIRYPSFPAQVFFWENVAQVLLKDDILTIDLKDNKLLQFNLDKEVAAAIDTDEFNRSMGEWVNG